MTANGSDSHTKKCLTLGDAELRKICIALEPSGQEFINYSVEDLCSRILALTGLTPQVEYSWGDFDGYDTVIAVGRNMVNRLHSHLACIPQITDGNPGEQGLILKTSLWTGNGNKRVIAAGGSDPYGTNYAVIELIKSIEVSGTKASIPEMDRNEKPDVLLRGAYAHNHWVYNYPYCARTWKIEDWKKYIDLLSYMKFNFLQIWVPVDFIPSPLTEADRVYLNMIREVTDYAKDKRGFLEVFIGAGANTVTYPGDLPPIEIRDYNTYVKTIDPAIEENIQYICSTRKEMISIISNATGNWLIDSDPGSWPCDVSVFADLLSEYCKILAAYNGNSKLILWNWMGWGHKGSAAVNKLFGILSRKLEWTWWPLVCKKIWEHTVDIDDVMPILDRLGKRGDTIYFPYGATEAEPSLPFRWKMFNSIRRHVFDKWLQYPGMKGIIVNAQTQINQILNYYFFAEMAWDIGKRNTWSDMEACEGLARLLYPDQYKKIAAAFNCITPGIEYEEVLDNLKALKEIIEHSTLGNYGVLAGKLLQYEGIAVDDLILQLGCYGYALKFESQAANASRQEVRDTLAKYFKYAGNSRKRYEYYGYECFDVLFGESYITYVKRFEDAWSKYCARVSADEADSLLEEVIITLGNDSGVKMEGVRFEMNNSCKRNKV